MAAKMETPQGGNRITIKDGRLIVPDNPIIPFIEGDGIGGPRVAAYSTPRSRRLTAGAG